MKLFCITKGDEVFVGTKMEILNSIGNLNFNDDGHITFKHHHYVKETLNSYSDEWSEEEKIRDVVNVVFSKLPSWYGYRCYNLSPINH